MRGPERECLRYLFRSNYKEIQLHLRSQGLIFFVVQVIRCILAMVRYHPDIVLVECLSYHSFIAGWFMGRLLKIPYAVRINGDLIEESKSISHVVGVKERILKRLNSCLANVSISNARVLFPISSFTEHQVKLKFGQAAPPTQVVHIPYSQSMESKSRLFKKKSTKKHQLLCVTNFNFKNKIRALANFLDRNKNDLRMAKDISIKIAGDGYYKKSFLAENTYLKDFRNVDFIGFIPDLWKQYSKADALLYLSYQDGLPNVILEAGIFRLPIFINKNCPAVEFVIKGINGIPLELDGKDLFTMRQILHDRNRLLEMGKTSQRHIKQNFNQNIIAAQYRYALMMYF